MRDLTSEETRLVNYFFSLPEIKARRIAATPRNTALMEAFCDEYLHAINIAGLTWMVNQLAPRLDYLAGANLTSELQAGAEAQKQLSEAQAEKNRQARELLKRQERQARQDAQTPGIASAMAGSEEDPALRQRDAADAQKREQREILHQNFLSELRNANNHIETMNDGSNRISYSKTESARRNMKLALKRKYPQFASEVRD